MRDLLKPKTTVMMKGLLVRERLAAGLLPAELIENTTGLQRAEPGAEQEMVVAEEPPVATSQVAQGAQSGAPWMVMRGMPEGAPMLVAGQGPVEKGTHVPEVEVPPPGGPECCYKVY